MQQLDSSEPAAPPGLQQRLRSDFATAALHWTIVALFLVNLTTGLRIASDASDASWSSAVDAVLLQGDVYVLHIWSAWALTAACIAYIIFLLAAHLGPRVALDASRFRALSSHDRRTRWQSINVLIYWLAFLLVGAAAVTGSLMYFHLLPESQSLVTTLHRVVAWTLFAYIFLHVIAQWAMAGWRGLLKIVTPRLAYMAAAVIAFAGAGAFAAGLFALDQMTLPKLVVAKVSEAPSLDGEIDDAAWRTAGMVVIDTHKGANLPNGSIPVHLRAVHDGTHAYLLFEWPDTTRSQKHLPLEKTAEGWRVVQTDFARADEDRYYEDKFAVMLSRDSQLAALHTSHLGARPLDDLPGPKGGRGLHYTTDNSVVDVWHWKSVRVGPLGQIDDNYFGPPRAAPESAGARYTGGYTQDPKTGGGFTMNWEKFDTGTVQPRWLPRSPDVLAERMGPINMDPDVGDDGLWWLPRSLMVEATPEHDALFPVGTVMPSVIVEEPFQGDRGDVEAVAEWRDGWWRMEVKRKLESTSDYDVTIGEGTYLWVSIFDHTQTRHSFHLRPVQLELQ
ncbi:ethylbenzene dehydrogenase-related protein [Pelagibius sp.]|uniref:ethylbenzene dehydrogenase-related protein n=1 Tax=Pelagibius sp. TaxID=1931238 RepID=UPI003BB02A70